MTKNKFYVCLQVVLELEAQAKTDMVKMLVGKKGPNSCQKVVFCHQNSKMGAITPSPFRPKAKVLIKTQSLTRFPPNRSFRSSSDERRRSLILLNNICSKSVPLISVFLRVITMFTDRKEKKL